LLLQVQGVIAEYERTKIKERCRRGKLHAARHGRVAALGKAPYGYRYVTRQEGGGEARYDVVPEEARVVRQGFTSGVLDPPALGAACRRLMAKGTPTPRGKALWRSAAINRMLRHPAYQGEAAFGKSHPAPRQRRPPRGRPAVPRQPYATAPTPESEWVRIPVPA